MPWEPVELWRVPTANDDVALQERSSVRQILERPAACMIAQGEIVRPAAVFGYGSPHFVRLHAVSFSPRRPPIGLSTTHATHATSSHISNRNHPKHRNSLDVHACLTRKISPSDLGSRCKEAASLHDDVCGGGLRRVATTMMFSNTIMCRYRR